MRKIIDLFLTKKFISFCIVGLIAYFVHQGVYLLYINGNLFDDPYHMFSNGLAFIVASIFSALLNIFFVFKAKNTVKTTGLSILTYVIKYAITVFVSFATMYILNNNFDDTTNIYKFIESVVPIITTAVTMIFQFVCFNKIFKKREVNVNDNIE